MAIWGFFGSLGSGKDTLANYFLKIKLQKPNPKKIVSHVYLKHPHELLSIDEIFDKAINNTEYFRRKIIYISEFHLIMDSRRSTASVNVDFSQMLLIQLNKLDADLFFSCQTLDQLDKRIKENQKYFFFTHKVFRLEGLDQEVFYNGETRILYDIIDWDDRIVRNPINNELIPFDLDIDYVVLDGERTDTGSAILPWEVLLTIFENFDTREIIKFDRKKYLK